MKIYEYPKRDEWEGLLQRPVHDSAHLNATVENVLKAVRERGDDAVREYELQFDHVELSNLAVTDEEMMEAESLVSEELKGALSLAHHNIQRFHAAQRFQGVREEVLPGVECCQRAVPIQKVGLYIPGGTAPLFSTVLMLAIPARLAGCEEIVMCTPPQLDGKVNPVILVAARIAGVHRVFKIGGVQAIGAMAYGTQSVPRVFKIFGPGNQYVMCAKQQVSLHGVAIDMPAGPSEVCVMADEESRPSFVAADLLSQAEHGLDSQVLLLTTSRKFANEVQEELERQLVSLPRADMARKSLENSKTILLSSSQEMMDMANCYAPEHLIIETKDCNELAAKVVNAGSVFVGQWTPESAGDYASGTNHTLPTHGYAVAYSGVNLDSYMRKITFQTITPQGVEQIGPAVACMARGEMLEAHCRAMTLRLNEVTKIKK